MKREERRFLIKLYLGVFLMTIFCIWNINKAEEMKETNNDNTMIVMIEK